MTEKQKSTKRLGKAAVVLMALASLLGIGAVPALATSDERSWNMTVTVTDTSIPPCEENYTIASWDPDLAASFPINEIDLASPTALTFEVYLNFQDAMDLGTCASPNIEPTGNVTAQFSVLANELVGTVNCNPPGHCEAATMSNSEFGALIDGTLALKEDSTPGTYLATEGGSYLATLRVVWTLP
jgi:hypothetical protein